MEDARQSRQAAIRFGAIFASITVSVSAATCSLQEQVNICLQIATGVASVLAAMLTGIQTFLGYDKRAEKHNSAGAEYGAIMRAIEQQLVFSSNEAKLLEFVNSIRERLDKLGVDSPSLPRKIVAQLEHGSRKSN